MPGIETYTRIDEFLSRITKGDVPNHRIFNLAGRHDANVETTGLGDISLIPNVVVLPRPGGIQLEIVSDDVNDTDGGTGIRTVEIVYLDPLFDEQTEEITLDGTTPVNTVATDIQDIQWMCATSVGSNTVAEGNISLRDTSGVTTYEYIQVGGNQSLTARFTVPNKHKGYIVDWHVSGLKKRVDFYLRATVKRLDRSLVTNVFCFQDFEICEASNSGTLPVKFVEVPAQGQVKISGQADAAGGEAAGAFSMLVVEDL